MHKINTCINVNNYINIIKVIFPNVSFAKFTVTI